MNTLKYYDSSLLLITIHSDAIFNFNEINLSFNHV